MTAVTEPEAERNVLYDVDVVVIGGGPGGWPAAVSAARQGARVVLLERYGFLGGMGTAANVNQWSLRVLAKGIREPEAVVAGITREVVDRMLLDDGLFEPDRVWQDGLYTEIRWRTMFPYDPEVLKLVSLDMVKEAGVKLLLHTQFSQVIMDGDRIDAIVAQNKSGRFAVRGKVYIDATGDADVAAGSGAPFEVDEERLGGTIIFWVGNVDLGKAAEYQNLEMMGGLLRQAIDDGALDWGEDLFYSPTVSYAKDQPFGFGFAMCHVPQDYPARYTRQNEIRVWAAHVRSPDVLSVEGMSDAESQARQKVRDLGRFLRKYVPGFEDSYIVSSGAQVGIRETRRIVGDYVLTATDIRQGGTFTDVIARGVQEEFVKGYGEDPVFCPPHDIPYRALLPQGVSNLLVSGRCISLSPHAAKLHSPRTQETCMIIGQAAGVAAAQAAEGNGNPREVDIEKVQRALLDGGARLGDLSDKGGRTSEQVEIEEAVNARPSALSLSRHEAEVEAW